MRLVLLMASVLAAVIVLRIALRSAPRLYGISLAGKAFETSLDSETARYYVQEYLMGQRVNPTLDRRFEALQLRFRHRPPSREELTDIASADSPDFATMFYTQRLLADPESQQLQNEFVRLVAEGRPPAAIRGARPMTVLFAPGWLYKSHAENGAAFSRQLALMSRAGIDARLIPTGENASVEDNALTIADAVRGLEDDGRQYVVVSASKSGPEVALALGQLLTEKEARPVAAWLNIGGVLGGSPLADDALAGVKGSVVQGVFWWKGWPMDGLKSLRTDARRRELRALRIPPRVFVLNYVPAPMSADLSETGRAGYESMKSLGPNDGLGLLADEVMPGGATIVEPGLDHFLKTDDIDVRTMALVRLIEARLSR